MSLRWRLPWRACAVALAWLAAAPARAEAPTGASDPAEVPARPDDAAPLRGGEAPEPPVPGAAPPSPARPAAPPPPDDLPMIGESVVTGQPRHRVARDPTASATVISADDFAGEAKRVAELVSTAPGVAVDDYGGLGQLATASIRGSTANGVLVLLDGIPLQTAFGGGVDLSSIPRGWIDRIEVVRGVEGAHYGTGSLGGVLNVVTARPTDGLGSAEATAGSFGSLAGAAELGRTFGDGSVLVAVGGDRTAGDFPYLWQWEPDDPSPPPPTEEIRRNNGAWRAGGLAKARLPVRAATVDAVALVSAGRRELPGLPFAVTPGDWQSDGRALLAARIGPAGAGRALRLGGQLSARIEWLDARSASWRLEERFGAAGLGLEAEVDHGAGRLRTEAAGQLEGVRGDGVVGTRTRWRLSAAVSEELRLAGDRLRLSPAVRVDRDGPFDGLSGKVGGAWRLAGPFSLRASAGRTFRAPGERELHVPAAQWRPNPALRPEVGTGGDASLLVEGGPVVASLGLHATHYEDLIYYQQVSLTTLQAQNADRVLVRGVELEAATAPLLRPLGLSLQGSYTFLDTEILRGTAGELGNEVPNRARHRLYARIAVAPGPVEAHAEVHYVGAQWFDAGNVRRIPSTLLWNGGAGLRVHRDPALRVALELKNLADDRQLQDGYGNPLPGRSVWLTLSAATHSPKGNP